jgi:hypothetical protein
LTAPYDYFYHFRHILRKQSSEVLTPPQLEKLNVLLDYIDESYNATFDKIDATFSTRYIYRTYFTKLFGLDKLIIIIRSEFLSAYITERNSET